MLRPLFSLLERAAGLNQQFAINAIDTPEMLDKVVELNKNQLYEQGVDAIGTDLEAIGGGYATSTKLYKARRGERYDHVTLHDEGDFYNSMQARVDHGTGAIIIEANTIKEDGDLQNRWGQNVLGQTKESLMVIKPINRDNIIKALRSYL